MLDWIQFTLIHGPMHGPIQGSYAILFFTASDFIFTTKHIHNRPSFLLWPSCFILSGVISNCPLLFLSSVWAYLLFAFPYCSWSSHGKNTRVRCHFLLQWTMICLNSPLWPICLGWPSMACLIASLGYTSSFAMTRLWSMKGPRGNERCPSSKFGPGASWLCGLWQGFSFLSGNNNSCHL